MSADIEKAIKEIRKIQTRHTNTELQLAIQLQRNKILKEGLSAIYNILDDIRYNRERQVK